jgi:pimeloyl-ACP methyl ester carboxylesterase
VRAEGDYGGAAEPGWRGLDWSARERDAELAQSLAIERVVLIGHSMGAPIAVRFAARHPGLAEAIVLVAGAVYQFSDLLGGRRVLRWLAARPRETAAIATEILTGVTAFPTSSLDDRARAIWTVPHADPQALTIPLGACGNSPDRQLPVCGGAAGSCTVT